MIKKFTQNDDGKLFCFFSGYTKGLLVVDDVKKNYFLNTIHITLLLPKEFSCDAKRYIQLNGVICEIIKKEDTTLSVVTTVELVKNSSLKNITSGDKLSLGFLAEDEPAENREYLLHPTANSKAKLVNFSLQEGHQHTLKFDFECDDSNNLQNDKHLGLSGSSLEVKELKHIGNKFLFSVYAGRQTRETTQFNETMKIGDIVNITSGKF